MPMNWKRENGSQMRLMKELMNVELLQMKVRVIPQYLDLYCSFYNFIFYNKLMGFNLVY